MAILEKHKYTDATDFISKVEIGGALYEIKDTLARETIDALGSIEGLFFSGVKEKLPASGTKNGEVVIVGNKEYVWAGAEGNEEWHEFGDTTDHGELAYKDSASGNTTVAEQTVSGVKATGTSTGSISVKLDQTETEATLLKGNFTPQGSVTGSMTPEGSVALTDSDVEGAYKITGHVSAPSITVTPSTGAAGSVTKAGTAATYTQGAKAAWSASVADETLSFSFTENGDDSFIANQPTEVEFNNVMTGAEAALDAAPVFTADHGIGAAFTGATGSINATFAGTEAVNAVVTGVKYNAASVNATETKFNGADIELSVGAITVPSQTISVTVS